MNLRIMTRDLMSVDGPMWAADESVIVTQIIGGHVSRCFADATLSPHGERLSWPWSPTESPQSESC